MLQTIRNIAIILLIALGVDLLPGGGEAADAVMAALSMTFLAAIAWMLFRFYREQQFTLSTLSDGRRALLFGSIGAIALLIVGFDEFDDFAGGILLWIALMAAAVGGIFLVWRDATSYT